MEIGGVREIGGSQVGGVNFPYLGFLSPQILGG
jgi:hypothetical protein